MVPCKAADNLLQGIKTRYVVNQKDSNQAGLWSSGKLLKNYNNSLPYTIKALGECCYDPE
jgi:hypothetical protein